jgi:hypothetical protein
MTLTLNGPPNPSNKNSDSKPLKTVEVMQKLRFVVPYPLDLICVIAGRKTMTFFYMITQSGRKRGKDGVLS